MNINKRVVLNLRDQGFQVYTRRQWGAEYGSVYAERRKTKPALIPADTVVQHITVTIDTGPLSGDFKTDMRRLEQIGYERFKTGISYNWVVDMQTGEIGQGMPLDAKGAHTVNNKDVPNYSYDQNYAARAIAVLGMPKDYPSLYAQSSIVGILVAMMEEGAITTGFDYVPHSIFTAKDCPCDPTRDRMGDIRRTAARRYARRNP